MTAEGREFTSITFKSDHVDVTKAMWEHGSKQKKHKNSFYITQSRK